MPPKKTFEKPGQTIDFDETTPDGPALKIFYETLMQQRPDSAMAAEWLLKRGMLEDDDAQAWLKKLGKSAKTGSGASKPRRVCDSQPSRARPCDRTTPDASSPLATTESGRRRLRGCACQEG